MLSIYFLDTTKDGQSYPDRDGSEFSDLDSAKLEASRTMTELCRDYLPSLGTHVGELELTLRDRRRQVVFRLALTYASQSFS